MTETAIQSLHVEIIRACTVRSATILEGNRHRISVTSTSVNRAFWIFVNSDQTTIKRLPKRCNSKNNTRHLTFSFLYRVNAFVSICLKSFSIPPLNFHWHHLSNALLLSFCYINFVVVPCWKIIAFAACYCVDRP